MKKALSLILALVLVVGMSFSVFATENSETIVAAGNKTIDVTGTYQSGTTSSTVFSVDIAWTAMSFTYQEAIADTWNTATHKYNDDGTDAGWTADSTGTITITNHSNAFITVTPSYEAKDGYTSAGMNFSTAEQYEETLYITSAEVNTQEETGTITVTPSGTLPSGTSGVTIGTITLSINEMTKTISELNSLMEYYSSDPSADVYNDQYLEASDVYSKGTEATQSEINMAYIGLITAINALSATD